MGLNGFASATIIGLLISTNLLAAVPGMLEGEIITSSKVRLVYSGSIKDLLPQGLKLSHQAMTSSDKHPVILLNRLKKDVREFGYPSVMGRKVQQSLMLIPFVEVVSEGKIVTVAFDIKSLNANSYIQSQEAELTLSENDMSELAAADASKVVMEFKEGLGCVITKMKTETHFVESVESVEACF